MTRLAQPRPRRDRNALLHASRRPSATASDCASQARSPPRPASPPAVASRRYTTAIFPASPSGTGDHDHAAPTPIAPTSTRPASFPCGEFLNSASSQHDGVGRSVTELRHWAAFVTSGRDGKIDLHPAGVARRRESLVTGELVDVDHCDAA